MVKRMKKEMYAANFCVNNNRIITKANNTKSIQKRITNTFATL